MNFLKFIGTVVLFSTLCSAIRHPAQTKAESIFTTILIIFGALSVSLKDEPGEEKALAKKAGDAKS